MTARRGVELTMVVFAVAVTVLAYISVGLGADGNVPSGVVWYGAGLGALFLVAHLTVRRVAPYAEPLLLPIAALLNGLGLVMIHRIDLATANKAQRLSSVVPPGNAGLQLAWTAIGITLFVVTLVVIRDHRTLARYTYTAMALGLVLLLLPALLPASLSEVNGARIWIHLGPLSFQPGEIAKIVLVVFFAAYLVGKRELLSLAGRRFAGLELPRARDMGPVLLAWGATLAILIRESDLGTALLFFGFFLVMLYVATQRASWLLIGLGLFCVGALLASVVVSHVQERVDIWLHPFADPTGNGYQLVQGLFGFANGGIFGTGLGQGRPDLVPFASTDFIASAFGEELGLIGLTAILVLYLLFVERGVRAALSVRDGFGKLLAIGLAFAVALQVFVQVGGVMRLIPLTGLTLPFLSYGGSSLVSSWIIVALLLRVSDAARRPVQPPPPAAPAGEVLAAAPTEVFRR